MFSSFGSKLVMKKLGIPTDVMKANPFGGEPEPPKKAGKKDGPAPVENPDEASAWPKWMTVRNLPLTVQPWLSPAPPPVPIAAECPKIGEPAPMDRDKKLVLGGGKKVVVVFLRCVGCACKSFFFFSLSFGSSSSSTVVVGVIIPTHYYLTTYPYTHSSIPSLID